MSLTLISGGAKGSHTVFENLAREKQFNIKIYRPENVSKDIHSFIDTHLTNINNSYINRKYPTNNEYVNNLLKRDYIVGTETDILYAISWSEHTSISNSKVEDNINVHGGTAWAVMSFINNCIKFLNDNKKQGLFDLPCYI